MVVHGSELSDARVPPRSCEKCGKTFYAKNGDDTCYCSHRCHLLGGGHPNWRGGRTRHKGYVLVRVYDDDPIAVAMGSERGYVPEHRLVMARALGRPLEAWEQVHHINGDKADNRLTNLELRIKPHGPGVVMVCRSCGSRDVRPARLSAETALGQSHPHAHSR